MEYSSFSKIVALVVVFVFIVYLHFIDYMFFKISIYLFRMNDIDSNRTMNDNGFQSMLYTY